jgi:N-acetyl-1-D-myo-inositol-2-amino-2-deoxy-alpha-D-glucopyranoside deacetylase
VLAVNPGSDRAAIMTVVLVSLFALVIGVAVGFVTTFTHRELPPWGLVAGLAVITAAVLGFRLVFSSRVIGAAAAVGAIGATALLTLPGAGGTAFAPSDPIGYAWAIAPSILAVVALAWPYPVAGRKGEPSRSRMDA